MCRDRVRLLRELNPRLLVHVLFGGRRSAEAGMRRALGNEVDGWHAIRGRPPRWKWLHGDLAVREWYRRAGHRLPFEVLHLVEWDLALLAPLTRLYGGVPGHAVGLTGLTPLARVAGRWWWTTAQAKWWVPELERLRARVERRFGRVSRIDVCQGPGTCLPRAFLDRYAAEKVPRLCHDEVRLPLYARALGFPLRNTGFLRDWYAPRERRLFNCQNEDVSRRAIARELRRHDGRRAFHPCRVPVADLLPRVAARR